MKLQILGKYAREKFQEGCFTGGVIPFFTWGPKETKLIKGLFPKQK
jgi:hypothetical protein